MAKYTVFGKAVKRALIDKEQNGVWLVEKVHELTGLYFDDAYLSKILTGQRNGVKIVQAIKDILNIPDTSQS